MVILVADEIFTEAPEEVTRYFDAKAQRPSLDWTDVAPHEHATAFTVAQTAGYDVLDDIRAAVDTAVRDYGSYGEFVDDLEPILRKKGWWGRAVRQDGKEVQLGSLRRLRTIYWANTRTARAAGEWERIQRTKRGIPFLIYELSGAENRRPEHEGWVGVILKVDDTWWLTHFPPNGWLCQCRVRQITRFEAEELGYDAETPAPEITTRPWTNKKTGETVNVPRGIDPGWQSHPGITRERNTRSFLSQRLDTIPADAARSAVRDLVGSAKFRAVQQRKVPYDHQLRGDQRNDARGHLTAPVASLSDQTVALLRTKTRTVQFSVADADKQVRTKKGMLPGALFVPEDYQLVQKIVTEGALYEVTDNNKRYVFKLMIEGNPFAAILGVSQDRREIFLKSFRRIRQSHFDERNGEILMREASKLP